MKFFEDKPLYIVDGHHRYTSSLEYAKEVGVAGNIDEPASQMFFAICNVYDPAVVVLPTHRQIRGVDTLNQAKLSETFEISEVDWKDVELFTNNNSAEPAFILSYMGKNLLCIPKNWKENTDEAKALVSLSVYWSDRVLLRDICQMNEHAIEKACAYHKSAELLWNEKQLSDMAIFLPPIPVEGMTEVADANAFMPQKSTFFFPKLASGLLLRSFS